MGKRYRRRRRSSSVVSDAAAISARRSWKIALLLGVLMFVVFYFILPAWITSLLSEREGSGSYPFVEEVLSRRLHWIEWIGIACGLVGLFFAIRNYYLGKTANWKERGLVAFFAKWFAKNID